MPRPRVTSINATSDSLPLEGSSEPSSPFMLTHAPILLTSRVTFNNYCKVRRGMI